MSVFDRCGLNRSMPNLSMHRNPVAKFIRKADRKIRKKVILA